LYFKYSPTLNTSPQKPKTYNKSATFRDLSKMLYSLRQVEVVELWLWQINYRLSRSSRPLMLWQVSNLFARDEMDEILEELVPVMKKEFPRRAQTNENLYSYYNARVRRHLHVVLCFSPVNIHTDILRFYYAQHIIHGHHTTGIFLCLTGVRTCPTEQNETAYRTSANDCLEDRLWNDL